MMSILRWIIVVMIVAMLVFSSRAAVAHEKELPSVEVVQISINLANTIGYAYYCDPLTDKGMLALQEGLHSIEADVIADSSIFDKQLDAVVALVGSQGVEATCVVLSLVIEDLDGDLFQGVVK